MLIRLQEVVPQFIPFFPHFAFCFSTAVDFSFRDRISFFLFSLLYFVLTDCRRRATNLWRASSR